MTPKEKLYGVLLALAIAATLFITMASELGVLTK